MNQAHLKQVMIYDSLTGLFWWRVRKQGARLGKPAGNIDSSGYLKLRIEGKTYSGASLAWLYIHGVLPELVDHIDRNPLNNRIDNLRPASARLNAYNRGSWNKTGLPKGVQGYEGHYRAIIGILGTPVHLGTFKTKEEASAAYERELAKQIERTNIKFR